MPPLFRGGASEEEKRNANGIQEHSKDFKANPFAVSFAWQNLNLTGIKKCTFWWVHILKSCLFTVLPVCPIPGA
jgi:hypothetical protein